jgi:hypothetical protein
MDAPRTRSAKILAAGQLLLIEISGVLTMLWQLYEPKVKQSV